MYLLQIKLCIYVVITSNYEKIILLCTLISELTCFAFDYTITIYHKLCPTSLYTQYMTSQHAVLFLHKPPIHHNKLYEHYSMLTHT